jgi:methionyl-tRNA formyltransferase
MADTLRVYYLASGAIAVPVLAELAASSQIDLVGCGTQPDRPRGRRRQLHATPIGAWCEDRGIGVDKINNVNDATVLARLQELAPDIILVFAFGQLLKPKLLDIPRHGCINIHTSLLPKYRGASPINAAIVNGDERTGVTIMQIEPTLDTGPVYCREAIPVDADVRAPELERRLADTAASMICAVLIGIGAGTMQAAPQDHAAATITRKLTKEDGHITWQQPAEDIERMVRGYDPWPGAWAVLPGRKARRITITRAAVQPDCGQPAGIITTADKHQWIVSCSEGCLEILSCVPEGKREMSGAEFLRGSPLQAGMNLLENETTTGQLRTTSA